MAAPLQYTKPEQRLVTPLINPIPKQVEDLAQKAQLLSLGINGSLKEPESVAAVIPVASLYQVRSAQETNELLARYVGTSGSELNLKAILKEVKITGQPIAFHSPITHESYQITSDHIWTKLKGNKSEYLKGSSKTQKKAENESRVEVTRLVSHDEFGKDELYHEYEILKTLSGRRGIVQGYDLVESKNKNGRWTLTLYEENYIHGDLQTFFYLKKVIPEDQKDKLAGDVIYGVHAAHSEGIALIDIKPENIVLGIDEKGELKAAHIDFNKATNTRTKKERPKGVNGTIDYSPPEKAAFYCSNSTWPVENEFKGDIYSLGLILQCLYGERLPPWCYIAGSNVDTLRRLGELKDKKGSYFAEPKDKLHHLIWEMCQNQPENRPTINDVITRWEELRKEGVGIKPNKQ